MEHRLFTGLQRLAGVRSTQQALHGLGDEHVLIPDNDHLFLVHRTYEGAALLLAANFSHSWQRARLKGLPEPFRHGYAVDVLAGQRLHFATGDLVVPPYTGLWLAPAEAEVPRRTVDVPVRLHVPTEPGEMVYLSGATETLGGGRPESAFGPLDPAAYPVWRGVIKMPEGRVFEMRWLKKREEKVVAWAPAPCFGIGSTAYPPPGC